MLFFFTDNHELITSQNAPLYKNGNETLTDSSLTSYRSKLNCDAAIQACIAAEYLPNMIIIAYPCMNIAGKVLDICFPFFL